MLKTNESVLEAFAGFTEPVASFVSNDLTVLRTRKSNIPYKQSSSRTTQLEKIKVCNNFTKAFAGSGFFDKSFPATIDSVGTNGLDRVTTVLMTKALTGNYPDIKLSYPKVLVSKGKLPSAKYAAAVPMKGGSIYFSFTDNSGFGSALPTDKVIVVAYSETLQMAVFSLQSGLRKDCEAILHAKELKGQTVETWIGFLAKDGSIASDSVYTGSIRLA